jgi:hypothetical protein
MVTEYQQVAALLCMDIDTWVETAENNPEMALDALRELKKRKDEMIGDENIREMRYNAACALFSLNKS